MVAEDLQERIERHKASGRTVTVKVKYANYEQVTRSQTLLEPLNDGDSIRQIAHQLLALTEAGDRPVRLVGISLSNLVARELDNQYQQLTLTLE